MEEEHMPDVDSIIMKPHKEYFRVKPYHDIKNIGEMQIAICMSKNDRLGQESVLSLLPPKVLRMICTRVITYNMTLSFKEEGVVQHLLWLLFAQTINDIRSLFMDPNGPYGGRLVQTSAVVEVCGERMREFMHNANTESMEMDILLENTSDMLFLVFRQMLDNDNHLCGVDFIMLLCVISWFSDIILVDARAMEVDAVNDDFLKHLATFCFKHLRIAIASVQSDWFDTELGLEVTRQVIVLLGEVYHNMTVGYKFNHDDIMSLMRAYLTNCENPAYCLVSCGIYDLMTTNQTTFKTEMKAIVSSCMLPSDFMAEVLWMGGRYDNTLVLIMAKLHWKIEQSNINSSFRLLGRFQSIGTPTDPDVLHREQAELVADCLQDFYILYSMANPTFVFSHCRINTTIEPNDTDISNKEFDSFIREQIAKIDRFFLRRFKKDLIDLEHLVMYVNINTPCFLMVWPAPPFGCGFPPENLTSCPTIIHCINVMRTFLPAGTLFD